MSEDYKVIYQKDLEEEDINSYFNNIKEKNVKLYDCIMENLRKENSLGIREDILKYISGHISEFKDSQEYAFNIASLICNVKITTDYLEWVNYYFQNIDLIKISDFMIVFSEAVEKDIPLAEIKKFFSEEEKDELRIYDMVMSYTPSEASSDSSEEVPTADATEVKSESVPGENRELATVADSKEETVNDNDPGMASMFDNLLTVMTYRNKNTDESVIGVQENINKILAKFQIASTEMTTYCTSIIREWERDKEEIEHLTALNKIQQEILGNQQNKINELRNDIIRLNERIQAAEKSEMQRDAIRQKISELDTLASDMSRPTGNEHSFLGRFLK